MSTQAKRWILVSGLVCGQLLMSGSPARSQVVSNNHNTSSTSFLDTCSGEMVNLTIEAHSVVRLIGTDPDGTSHFSTHVNFHGEGVGAVSGDRYNFNGNSKRVHSIAPGCVGSGEAETYTRLISQGNSGNRYVRTSVQLVASPTGPGGSCILVTDGPPTISVTCHG